MRRGIGGGGEVMVGVVWRVVCWWDMVVVLRVRVQVGVVEDWLKIGARRVFVIGGLGRGICEQEPRVCKG